MLEHQALEASRLVQRLDAVRKSFFLRRQEDSGFKPLEPEVLKVRCQSFEKHLSNYGVSPELYDRIYELSLDIYNEGDGNKGPWGVDFVIQACKRFKQSLKSGERFEKEVRVKNPCVHCLGTSLEHTKNEEGKLENIVYEEVNGKKVAKRCEHCYVSENKEVTP